MNDLFDKSRPRRNLDGGRSITIRGAREHNLKNVDVEMPRDQLVVFTGLSGSGKSSLAFDTIYAEGQRRYVESLSAYARQFLEMMQKPDVDQIDGLSPAISIEQKTTSKNPRSTVGTVTEIYDYMRLLWARVGVPYSPATGLPIESQTVSQMVDRIMALPEGTRLYLLAPVVRGRKGEYRKELAEFLKKGYQRVKVDGEVLRDRRGAGARQEIHPRHRRGGRPHRGARRHRHAARGLARAGAQARRRPRDRRDGGRRGGRRREGQQAAQRDRRAADLLGKIRLPGLRLHHPGGRAAPVLVQQPVRRLPEMRRARRRAAHRRRPGDPGPRPHAESRRDRAVGEVVEPLLHADAQALGKFYKFTLDTKWKDLPKKAQRRDPERLGRGRDPLLLRRRHAEIRDQEAVRGRRDEPRAPLEGNRERVGARGDREVFPRRAVRRLQRLSGSSPRRCASRSPACTSASSPTCRSSAPANGSRRCRRTSTSSRTRSRRAS